MLLTLQIASAQPFSQTPLGLWRFEEGSGNNATDSSGNENHGTFNGPVYTASKGTNNTGTGALDFDGTADSSVLIINNGDFTFNPSEPFSFGAWVNMDDATTFRLGGVRASGTNTEWFFTIDGSDAARFHVHDNSAGAYIGEVSTSKFTSDENTWIFLAVTYDGGLISNGLKIYRNSVIMATISSTVGTFLNIDDTDAEFEIGSINNQTAVADGTMDEVFVIDQELSSGEIQQIYNFGWNVTLPDTNNPSVTLDSPLDNSVTNETSNSFQCSAVDDISLSHMNFYWNISGAFIENGTDPLSSTSDSSSFVRTTPHNSTILWNCEASDSSNNTAFASANFTLTINQTFAQPAVIPPVPLSPDEYSLAVCPLQTISQSFLYAFFWVIAISIVVLGFIFKNGMTMAMGAFAMFILSLYLWVCIAAFALILAGVSIFMGILSWNMGSKGFR